MLTGDASRKGSARVGVSLLSSNDLRKKIMHLISENVE
jgi:hypothetical protein